MTKRRPTPTVCNNPGCPELTNPPHATCPTHQPKPWAGSNRRNELPPNWATLKTATHARDNWQCTQCGAPPPLECDHIADKNNHHPTNLQSLCTNCHKAKTLQQAANAKRHTQ